GLVPDPREGRKRAALLRFLYCPLIPRYRPQNMAGIGLSAKRSIAILGTMRPKLMASMIEKAVAPSALVALQGASASGPLTMCRSPLTMRNKKTPGIIETTAANPMAAKGICHRRATGVRTKPTKKHATKAPTAALAPSSEMLHHL